MYTTLWVAWNYVSWKCIRHFEPHLAVSSMIVLDEPGPGHGRNWHMHGCFWCQNSCGHEWTHQMCVKQFGLTRINTQHCAHKCYCCRNHDGVVGPWPVHWIRICMGFWIQVLAATRTSSALQLHIPFFPFFAARGSALRLAVSASGEPMLGSMKLLRP